MKFAKILFFVSLMLTLFFVTPPSVYANESSVPHETELDLDSIDTSQPFSEEYNYIDEQGEDVTITLSFEPAPETNTGEFQAFSGSKSNKATVGTWTSSYKGGIVNMSYRFDVSKSGSQWKISNARGHSYSGLATNFSKPSLKISRAVSTNSFAAEINASVYATVFDNAWTTPIWAGTWVMYTKINSSGTMTLYWN